jgi:tetratricopeptide (TPR) repeat protein
MLLTDQKIAETLKQAVHRLNLGEPDQAEILLAEILGARPALPQALMLMGMARLLQNRNAEAEVLFSNALIHSPEQSSLFFHLGSALRAQGKAEESVNAYRRALRLDPGYTDAHLALGAALREAGDFSAAEKAYGTLLQQEPQNLAALAGLGASLIALDRAMEAEQLLGAMPTRQADPGLAELENILGEAKLRQRRPAESLAHFERSLAQMPGYLPAQKNRATALENLRDHQAAAAAYQGILARDPLDLETHLLLNELLHRIGDATNFLRSYDEAAGRTADKALLAGAKADQLLKMGRAAEAHDSYLAALAHAPGSIAARIGLGRALAALGEYAPAIAAFEAGLRQHPDDADLQTAFAWQLLASADPHKAQRLAQSAVTRQPHSQAALSVLDLCYRVNQDGRADRFNDFENFVRVFDLEPPQGYNDMAQFSADLGAHVDAMHVGSRALFSQTLRGGTRGFEEFFGYSHELRAGLRQRVQQALGDYIGAMAEATDHPFLGRRAKNYSFAGSWSSRMAAGGFHLNHIHSAWISSVYYVAVPEAVGDWHAKEGWLKFGEPPSDVGLKDAIRRTVQPKPGRLVLFPSYMWHGTIPYRAPGARTTIAFDVVPH